VDFWDLTKLLVRRWYIAGPLLLLTLGGVALAAMRIEPDYVATSYVQLVPPSVTPKESDGKAPQPRNPWLDLGVSSLGKAAMLTVQDQKVVKMLKKVGYSDDFTLTLDSTLPIVTFEVIGDTEAQASATTEELIKRFGTSVKTLQDEYGAAKDQSITTRQLDLGDNVDESTAKVKRALVAIGAVGLLLTVALTIAFDAIVRRRRADKVAAAQADQDRTTRVNGSRTPQNGVAVTYNGNGRPRPRPPVEAEDPAEKTAVMNTGAETQKIVLGEDRTIVLPRATWAKPSDKG